MQPFYIPIYLLTASDSGPFSVFLTDINSFSLDFFSSLFSFAYCLCKTNNIWFIATKDIGIHAIHEDVQQKF